MEYEADPRVDAYIDGLPAWQQAVCRQVRDLVQVKDVTQIETRGLSEQQVDEVRQFMAQMGVRDPQITHPTTTLEDLFIRIVNENTRPGTSSVSSDVLAPADGNGSGRH